MYDKLGIRITTHLNNMQRRVLKEMDDNAIITRMYKKDGVVIKVSRNPYTETFRYTGDGVWFRWLVDEGFLVPLRYKSMDNGNDFVHYRLSAAGLIVKRSLIEEMQYA